MAATIQVRRGTKAALVSHGALAIGELGFTTDEHLVYVGDGSSSSNYVVGGVITGTSVPVSTTYNSGTLYVNTTTDILYLYTGSAWVEVGASSLDSIADGTSYKRVAAGDIDASNHVTQIYDDTNSAMVTAAGITGHTTNAAIHRSINDSGTANTDLWSAQKVQSVITSSTVGIGEFQIAVKASSTLTPPGSPTTGDRYLVNGTGTGAWSTFSKTIVQWSGSAWVSTAATDGMAVYSDADGILFLYNLGSTSWLALNNYVLASSAPGVVSSSSSGATGSASTIARGDHSHKLGSHSHADSTSGGTISYAALTSIPSTFAPSAHGSSAHSGTIGTESQVTFAATGGHTHSGSDSTKVSYANLSSIPSTFAPSSHASSHKYGGGDLIGTATAAANSIPMSGAGGTLDIGWLPIIDGGSF